MSIYEKLLDVQNELQVPKTMRNDYNHYKYRSVESILFYAQPILNEHGLVITLSDELVMIGERYYIKSTAKIIDVESGESCETNAWAREEREKKGMDSSQITGASSSYARKYALNGLLAINDVQDSDTPSRSGYDASDAVVVGGTNVGGTGENWGDAQQSGQSQMEITRKPRRY